MTPEAPSIQARRIYDREDTFRSFKDDLDLHLLNGYVISTPELFVMARPVPRIAARNAICDPAVTWPTYYCSCWHVHIYAGKLPLLFTLLPYELPYGSFQKRDRLRFYTLNQLKERFHRYGQRTESTKRPSPGGCTS